MKKFQFQRRIGTCKYAVSFHDGIKKHRDGSEFYDIVLFQNYRTCMRFIKSLKERGYVKY